MIKILLIEDDASMRGLYQAALSNEDMTIVAANDGASGLEKAETESPAIILLDVMMPGMNGIEVLDKLKANKKTQSIPVIMLSNLADEATIQSSKEKGALEYIIKSEIDPEDLKNKIKTLSTNEAPTAS